MAGLTDCVQVLKSYCRVLEFKPDSKSSISKGKTQLSGYVPDVTDYFQDTIDGKIFPVPPWWSGRCRGSQEILHECEGHSPFHRRSENLREVQQTLSMYLRSVTHLLSPADLSPAPLN